MFIVLGIFLLMVGGALIFLSSGNSLQEEVGKPLEIEQSVNAFQGYIDSCAEQKGKKVLVALGYYGGKDDFVGPYFDAELFDSNYLVFNNELRAPSIAEIKRNGESLFDEGMKECLSSFIVSSNMAEQQLNKDIISYDLVFDSLQIKEGELETEMILTNNEVSFEVHWPLEIGQKDFRREVSEFNAGPYPVRLEEVGVLVQNFTSQLAQNPYFIDPVYLLDYNLSYDVTIVSNDTYIVLITDNQSLINYEPLQFLFAVKVNSTEGLI